MEETVRSHDYLQLLETWLKPALQYVYIPPERSDFEVFGPGFNSWGVQTNQKGLAAFAVCAADPEFDESRARLSRDEVIEHALRMLRFSLESHVSNTFHCTDNTQWGHTWISGLGIERMMHGVSAIEEHLADRDGELLRRVLVSEALWLLDEHEVRGRLYAQGGNNRPESNMWNGALMLRTAAMYPDIERIDEIKEKGITFLINAVSVPEDEHSEKIIDGKPVRERFIGPNFFSSYALNHHGYLNTGYMVICLSNAAMLYFRFRQKGVDPPEALFNHIGDLWNLVKNLTFPDGRLARIGGDTRVRYCYCQDYCVPSWLFMEDYCEDDDCTAFEQGWLDTVETELKYNKTGLFLSERCSQLAQASPLYYTRLESDRACTLSMGAYWRRLLDIPGKTGEPSHGNGFSWHDEYHGSVVVRDRNSIASWTWDAAEKPQGMMLGLQQSNMAEWRENMAAEVRGEGSHCFQELISHTEQEFQGGFVTWGETAVHSREMTAEGQPDYCEFARQYIVCAALPCSGVMAVFQYVKTGDRTVCISSLKGIHIHVPNDVFNGNHRTYFAGDMRHEIVGNADRQETIPLQSKWVNVDNILGLAMLYGEGMLSLFRPGRRQIGLRHYPTPWNWRAGGMLYTDELCCPCVTETCVVPPETVLVDTGFIVQTGASKGQTAGFSEKAVVLHSGEGDLRGILVETASGALYMLVWSLNNSSLLTEEISVPGSAGRDLVSGETSEIQAGKIKIKLKPGSARLFEIQRRSSAEDIEKT